MCTRTHTRACTCVRARACACMFLRARARTRTCARACARSHASRSCTWACVRACVCEHGIHVPSASLRLSHGVRAACLRERTEPSQPSSGLSNNRGRVWRRGRRVASCTVRELDVRKVSYYTIRAYDCIIRIVSYYTVLYYDRGRCSALGRHRRLGVSPAAAARHRLLPGPRLWNRGQKGSRRWPVIQPEQPPGGGRGHDPLAVAVMLARDGP